VPLARTPANTPQAHVSGTIAGWSSLSAPDFGKYNLAVVLYSFTDEFGAPENSIAQPMSGSDPLNICLRTPFSDPPCSWQMNTRTGLQAHFALILRGDDRGSLDDPSDDTYELLGFAMKSGQNMSAGQNLTGQTLDMISVSDFANASVAFPAAPSGAQNDLVAIPFVDLGEAGQLPIALPTLTPGNTTTKVPPLSGAFSGARYNLVSLAVPAGAAARPFSSSFVRDVSFGATVSLPAWLPAPTGLQASGNTFSFTPAPAASAHVATFLNASENTVWSVTILDGSQSFDLPAAAPDPLPSGTVEMRVTAIDIPGFDPQRFSFANLADELAGASDDNVTFTH
jgi:hypothetical protein